MAIIDDAQESGLREQIRAKWGAKWQDSEVNDLARLLAQNGINDLSKLTFTAGKRMSADSYDPGSEGRDASITKGTEKNAYFADYDGKRIGFLGDINRDGSYAMPQHGAAQAAEGQLGWGQFDDAYSNLLGWSASGRGNTGFHVVEGPDGPTVVPVWRSGRAGAYEDARGVASVAALAAGGYYAGAGGAAGSTAKGFLTGYATGAGGAMLTGADPVKAGLAGGITGAIAGGAGALGAEQGINPAITKAGTNAIITAARGGSGRDIATGLVASGIDASTDGLTGSAGVDRAVAAGVKTLWSGGSGRQAAINAAWQGLFGRKQGS